jgi:hypothetical protein
MEHLSTVAPDVHCSTFVIVHEDEAGLTVPKETASINSKGITLSLKRTGFAQPGAPAISYTIQSTVNATSFFN